MSALNEERLHEQLLQEDEISRVRALEAAESFIVEAPAGAGKTELLTQRFLKLLQTVQEPEEVIAITFTNKAASEMRSRILDSLQQAADEVPIDKPHKQQTRELALSALQLSAKHNWRLLENPSRLRIYTIDSFSSLLSRQMPLMSRFGAQPGVREDATPYYEEAAIRTLELLDTDGGVGEVIQQALHYFDNDAYCLNRLLTAMLAKRDQWLDYINNDASPAMAEKALARMITQDTRAAADVLSPVRQAVLMPIARYAAANLPCEAPIALLRDWETPIPAKPEALAMWRAVCSLLLTGSDHRCNFRKRLDKNMGLPATDEAKPYKEQLLAFIEELKALPEAETTLANLRLLPDVRHEDETWQIIATLGRLLKIAVAQLWLVFQSHGEVDFVEVAQRALKALEDESGNPSDLALKLDYRIQHLLVDEFQDTSPTQVKLLQRLTRGWEPSDGRTLFAVGDPMQSIYRFRKANVGLFLRVADEGIGDLSLTKLRLWRNNRSCPPVIAWINRAFASVFPGQDSVMQGAISYRSFAATKPDETGSAVHIHPLIASNGVPESEAEETNDESMLPESIDAIRQREADKIIEIIRQTQDRRPGSKIAVLVRARSHLHALVSRIRRNHPNLSFQAVEIEELANRQIVQDLLSLAHALHHRADRVHWLAILRAPWCGLMLADLQALAGTDKYRTIPSLMHDEARLHAMSADGRARLLHVRNVMDEAMKHRGRQSTSRWVHGVWLMLGGADCLWEPGDVRDVQAFFEHIAKLDAAGRFSTEQLAVEVEKLYAAPDAEDDTLQFMTIHKSKGLEFDTVILPGLDRKTGNSDQPLLLWEEVPRENTLHDAAQFDLVAAPVPAKGANKSATPTLYDYLKQLECTRAANEDVRALYVAATRAERSLHLIGAAKCNDDGELKAPKNTFLDLLWPHVQAEFAAALGNAGEKSITAAQVEAGTPLADFVPKLVRLAEPALPAIFSQRAQQAASSRHAGRRSEQQAQSLAASTDNFDNVIGVLAHRYLEFVAKQGMEAWPLPRISALRPAMLKWLQKQGVKAEALESAVNRTIGMLQITLQSEDGRWLLQPRNSANIELPIGSYEEEEARMQRLDLTFVEDGVRWIIDYKSTRLAPDISEEELQKQALMHQEQLQAYAKLFMHESMPIKIAVFFLSVGRLAHIE